MLWFVIFVIWPLAELFVIIKIAEAVGFLVMLALLIISWPIGTRILRSQGRAAWRQFVSAIQSGGVPAAEVLNAALVLVGGVLLLVPGFISDAIGLLLLIPPTRALVSRAVARHHSSGWVTRAAGFGSVFTGPGPGPGRRSRGPGSTRGDYDVDSTAVDVDPPELDR